MKRAIAAALVAGIFASSGPGDSSRPRKVLIISMPATTWGNVEDGYTPNLRALTERASMASMSIRTVGAKTDVASAYATIGAGNRARGRGDEDASIIPQTHSPVGAAQDEPSPLTVSSMGLVVEDNRHLRFGAEPGTLGEALHRAGLRTGVVGNADGGYVLPEGTRRLPAGIERRRFAGLALADQDGRIDLGFVGEGLVRSDPTTLNGYSTDQETFVAMTREVLERTDVVIAEVADTFREGQVAFASLLDRGVPVPKEDDVPQRIDALKRDDSLLGDLAGLLDLRRDTLIVLSTSGLGPAKSERMLVAAVAGVGSHEGGLLTSPTTRRPGMVTIADVGPGILRLLDIEIPASMTGRAIRSESASGQRLERLSSLDDEASFHLRWVQKFFVVFVVLQLLLYLFFWMNLRAKATRRLTLVKFLMLAFLMLPSATMVLNGLRLERWGPTPFALMLLAVSLAGAGLAVSGPWRAHPAGPATAVCALALLLIAGDLMLGAPMQLSSLMGYSPIVAGRFFGLGNLGFAVLGTSAVLVASVLARHWEKGWWLAGGIGLAAILLDGLPFLGADFGGVVALVIGFGVLVLKLVGHKLSAVRLAGLAVLAAFVAAGIGFMDSLRPEQSQTHVGRFVSRLMDEGIPVVTEVVMRKAAANWSVLTNSVLSLSIPIAILFLIFMLRHPRGRLLAGLRALPELSAGLSAALAVNVAAALVNDSGIAIPAIGMSIAVPFLLATTIGLPPDAGDGRAAV